MSDANPASPSWVGLAACWQSVATPLRPGAQDSAWMQEVIDQVAEGNPRMSVLLLGVTREISQLRYPAPARLLAVDSSREMIGALWLPPQDCAALAVRARWEDLPLPAASVDLVLADGSFCALPDVRQIREVLRSVSAVLRPGARLCVRTFVSPEHNERLEDIERELIEGRAGSVHATKWRVAMALQGSSGDGVALADVWRVFERNGGCRLLAASNGWPAAGVATVEAYRRSTTRLCFPSLQITRELLAVHFEQVWCRFPSYELGERCPTLLLRRN